MIYFLSRSPNLITSEQRGSPIEEIDDYRVVLDYFNQHSEIAVDTETSGRDPHVKKIISLQLGDPFNQFVIDCRTIPITIFKELLENKLLILHNSKFDYKFLKSHGITIEHIYDTMLAECVLYCGYQQYGYGLDKVLKRYLDIDLDKTTRGEFFKVNDNRLTYKQIEYAALDVTYLHKVKELQLERAKKEHLLYTIDLENRAVKALADIEYNGMYLNKDKWLENTYKFEDLTEQKEKELDEFILNDRILSKYYKKNEQLSLFEESKRYLSINYSSPSQILKLLKYINPSIEDTSDRTLFKLQKTHEIFKHLQDYRKSKTICDRYGRSFIAYINNHTNRIHTDFWQVLNTGRVSSGSGEDHPNLQNIPGKNEFRNCFEARPGFLWVSIDYSSQELRLMADGSNEKAFIDVLNSGEDLHCYAGSMMFKRPITKEDKELRNKAKTINFGKPLILAACYREVA